MPHVSVIMGTYNVAPYVEDAVNSILTQTFGDFEFLIVDDASTDDTWTRLKVLRERDHRVRLWRNNRNLGLAASLNRLIDEAQGDIIARMDADDISLPDRFRRQVACLQATDLGIVGGWMRVFGDGPEKLQRYPNDHEAIKAGLLFAPMLSHPTVMIRRELLKTNKYNPSAGIVEDYDLWVRLATQTRMANLPTALLRHRRHPRQTSSSRFLEQWRAAAEISISYLDLLKIKATAQQKRIHAAVRSPIMEGGLSDVRQTENWLLHLIAHFDGNPHAQQIIAEHWYRYCLKAASVGPKVWMIFVRSGLLSFTPIHLWQKLAVLGLSLARVRYQSRLYRLLLSFSPAARTEAVTDEG